MHLENYILIMIKVIRDPSSTMTPYDIRHPRKNQRKIKKRKERRVDALALRAEERRDKLRKAAGSGKYTSIRRYLNGETRPDKLRSTLSKYRA